MTIANKLNCNIEPVEKKCFDVLIELMQTRNLEQCSLSEILQKAEIGKSTFYRHYRDKYDLLNQSYQNLLGQTFFTIQEGASYKKAFLTLYTTLQEHRQFFYHAFASEGQNSLRDCIYETMMEGLASLLSAHGFSSENIHNRYIIEAYVSGTLHITYTWMLNGAKESVEEMLKLVYTLMPEDIRTIIMLNYM